MILSCLDHTVAADSDGDGGPTGQTAPFGADCESEGGEEPVEGPDRDPHGQHHPRQPLRQTQQGTGAQIRRVRSSLVLPFHSVKNTHYIARNSKSSNQ